MALPIEPDECEWLIDRTAELVAAVGWRGYVSAPLVLPDAQSFPEPWTADARALRRLARRLLAYAGLGQLGVELELFEGERELELDAQGRDRVVGHQGAAAWFAGIVDGVCQFGCEVDQLRDPIGVVGAMAHEVAHAFRRHHAIEVEDTDLEERLTDLTSVYLGFGVLTTNAALRHRSYGNDDGLMLGHRWTRNQLGYLPAAAMAYALALWQLARGDDEHEAKAIRRALEINQAAWFKTSLASLRKRKASLALLRELPARETWPKRPELGELALPDAEDDDAAEPNDDAEPNADDEPGIVFRIRGRRAWGQGNVGLVAAGGGILVAMMGGSSTWFVAAFALVGGALAYGFEPIGYCSDPDCDRNIGPSDVVCPGCRRRIAGEISHRKHRLAAEEAVLEGRPLPGANPMINEPPGDE
ncbi:hypothetical protein ACNOYE_06275 [Nannocystaceae bacterium ST9]